MLRFKNVLINDLAYFSNYEIFKKGKFFYEHEISDDHINLWPDVITGDNW